MHPSSGQFDPSSATGQAPAGANTSVLVLAWMMFLLPALGIPSELVLQDTLKSAVAAFGILIAALVFFWHQRHRAEPLLWHGLVWLPLALMAYALGSMVWSHTYLAGVEAIRWFLLSLLLWLGLNTLTPCTLPRLVWAIHGGLVLASLWVACQFWFDWQFFPQGPQPASSFINRNFFAEYAVSALPFSVWALVTMRQQRWLGWAAASVALNILAILMTGTRSALIALTFLLPVLLLVLLRYRSQLAWSTWRRAQQGLVAGVLGLGILVGGLIPTGNAQVQAENLGQSALARSMLRTGSIAKPTEYTRGSFSIRSALWMATARMTLAHPLEGVGAGAWEVEIPLYQRVDTQLETDYYAHNEFLQLLSEYGLLVGGGVMAFWLAYLLKSASVTWQLARDQAEAPPRAFALSSLMAFTVVSNAGFPLHLACCGVLVAICLSILARSDYQLDHLNAFRVTRFTLSTRAAQSLLSLATGGLIVAAVISWQALRAESSLVQAIRTANAFNKAQRLGEPQAAELKTQALAFVREGIAIHPHYRKLTAEVAEAFAASGDWGNAVWILESVAASRPYVAALWTGLAQGYSALGEYGRAQTAFEQLQRLKPEASSTISLHAILLSQKGEAAGAAALLTVQLDRAVFDFEMLQTAYAIGYKNKNWGLAIRALELRNITWPETRTDGYLRLGKLYAEPDVGNPQSALTAFRAGLASVPADQRSNYTRQVPMPYQAQM